MTIKVVEPAVAHIHIHTATMAKPSTTAAAVAVNQIGVKKGRRWKLTWSFFMAP